MDTAIRDRECAKVIWVHRGQFCLCDHLCERTDKLVVIQYLADPSSEDPPSLRSLPPPGQSTDEIGSRTW